MKKGVLHVVWLITNECNLRCKHCYHENFLAESNNQVKLEIEKEIVKNIIEISEEWEILDIAILGGEALLNKNLFNIIDELKNNINCDVGIATNGTIMNENIMNKIIESQIFVQISLESYRKEFHEFIRGVDTFDKTIKTVEQLVANNIDVSLRMTVSKENFEDIEGFVELGKKLKVKMLSFNKFIDTKNNQFKGLSSMTPSMHKAFIDKIVKLKKKYGNDFITTEDPCINSRNMDYIEKMFEDELREGYPFGGCSIGLNTLVINSNGGVQPCTLIPMEIGNVMNRKLIEIWEDGENGIFDKLRERNLNLKGKCLQCKNVLYCGGCRAAAYHMRDDIFEEDPFCLM